MVIRAAILIGIAVAATLVDRHPADTARTPAGHLEHVLSDAALTVLVVLLGWVCTATLLARLRASAGPVGALADMLWRLAVPPMLRLGISAAVGVAGVTAPASALPAYAPAVGGVVGSACSPPAVDRPRTCHETTCSPVLPWVGAATASSALRESPGELVVSPGDSLWRIAQRHLGDDPSDAAVVAEWPRWYDANRAVIGPDPDLLRVGQVLRRPHDQASSA